MANAARRGRQPIKKITEQAEQVEQVEHNHDSHTKKWIVENTRQGGGTIYVLGVDIKQGESRSFESLTNEQILHLDYAKKCGLVRYEHN